MGPNTTEAKPPVTRMSGVDPRTAARVGWPGRHGGGRGGGMSYPHPTVRPRRRRPMTRRRRDVLGIAAREAADREAKADPDPADGPGQGERIRRVFGEELVAR